jgi:N-methylhydantoinase A/oxoprolinase/acetone carboxylase beta subunit
VYFPSEGAYLDTAYIDRDEIGRDDPVQGPAIVTEWDATTVVPPGAAAVLAPTGELVVAAAS